jgi:hypothetical protein
MVLCTFDLMAVGSRSILRVDNVSCGCLVDAGNVIQFFITMMPTRLRRDIEETQRCVVSPMRELKLNG